MFVTACARTTNIPCHCTVNGVLENSVQVRAQAVAMATKHPHISLVCRKNRFVLFYLPFLSSIHEKANCIAILWTGSPHSLGSCLFRGLWATCFPHEGGGIPLSALPKDTTSELSGLFSTTSHKCRAPSREAIDTIF